VCAESCGNKAANEITPILLIKMYVFLSQFGDFLTFGFPDNKMFKNIFETVKQFY